MSRRRALLDFGMIVLLSSVAAGCSGEPSLYPVKGVVKIDGTPKAGVTVHFWPDAEMDPQTFVYYHAMAVTNDAGEFQAYCGVGKEGMARGAYHVTFSRSVTKAGQPISRTDKREDVGATESIPMPYCDHQNPKNSSITAEVSGSTNSFTFEIPAGDGKKSVKS